MKNELGDNEENTTQRTTTRYERDLCVYGNMNRQFLLTLRTMENVFFLLIREERRPLEHKDMMGR